MSAYQSRDEERLAAGQYWLGALCKRGHSWMGSEQTLRRSDRGDCVQCHRETAHAQMVRERPSDWAEQQERRQLLPDKPYSQADVDRFWSKVVKGDDCWTFTGWSVQDYGYIYIQGLDVRASHFAWQLAYGRPVPKGLEIAHRCDNPPCVRPDHLWACPHAENIADRDAKGRTARGDRSGARLRPECLPRGEQHWKRKHPEWIPRGEKHWAKQRPELIRRGENAGHASLTNEQAVEIYRAYQRGEGSQRVLARRFGVSRDVVQGIVRRQTYVEATAPYAA